MIGNGPWNILAHLPNLRHVKGIICTFMDTAPPNTARPALLSLGLLIGLNSFSGNLLPSRPRSRLAFDHLQKLDLTLLHDPAGDHEIYQNDPALVLRGAVRLLEAMPDGLQSLSITGEPDIDQPMAEVLSSVIGRFRQLSTLSVLWDSSVHSDAYEDVDALGLLLLALPRLTRLVTAGSVVSLLMLPEGHRALRQVDLASVADVDHEHDLFVFFEDEPGCGWCEGPYVQLNQLLEARQAGKLPALERIVLRSSAYNWPLRHALASDGQFSFLKADHRVRLNLGRPINNHPSLSSALRRAGVSLVDEFGNVWREEWDAEQPSASAPLSGTATETTRPSPPSSPLSFVTARMSSTSPTPLSLPSALPE